MLITRCLQIIINQNYNGLLLRLMFLYNLNLHVNNLINGKVPTQPIEDIV